MSDSITVDAARLPLLLGELRLPTVAKLWQTFTERADREGWPSARLLATLAEFELAERAQRRVQRHLLEARLPSGKTLDQNPPPARRARAGAGSAAARGGMLGRPAQPPARPTPDMLLELIEAWRWLWLAADGVPLCACVRCMFLVIRLERLPAGSR
jgi:hypothetical protein